MREDVLNQEEEVILGKHFEADGSFAGKVGQDPKALRFLYEGRLKLLTGLLQEGHETDDKLIAVDQYLQKLVIK